MLHVQDGTGHRTGINNSKHQCLWNLLTMTTKQAKSHFLFQ